MLVLLTLSACATRVGARSLPDVRFDYTASIAQSAEQQMLLNIVRLRHRRLPVFLQVSSVVTQYAVSTNAGINGAYNTVGPGGFVPPASVGAAAGVMVEERPTITYTPLQGEDFVHRLATPLSSSAIAQLVQAGWPWDAVLACCVQQINGQFAPENPWREEQTDFQRLGRMLSELQRSHAITTGVKADGSYELVFAIPGTDAGRTQVAEVRALLGLDPDAYRYALSPHSGESTPHQVTLHGRSMMASMYYLSQGVEGVAGRPAALADALLQVREAKKAPSDAYASVDYNGRAFYIAADDTDSQNVFVMLTYLFSLMSTPGGSGPVVTVGAGG
ncbi:MAG: hypothetical protein AAF799_17460 [Myxococcota bacterium]